MVRLLWCLSGAAPRPEVFVERLAALVPAPQKNQVHYHGVFASAHRWRSLIVPDGVRRKKKAKARKQSGKPPGFDERPVPWEELLYRVFGRDVLLHSEPKARRSGVSAPPVAVESGWLIIAPQRGVDPFHAQLELSVMGMPVKLMSFRRGRP